MGTHIQPFYFNRNNKSTHELKIYLLKLRGGKNFGFSATSDVIIKITTIVGYSLKDLSTCSTDEQYRKKAFHENSQ